MIKVTRAPTRQFRSSFKQQSAHVHEMFRAALLYVPERVHDRSDDEQEGRLRTHATTFALWPITNALKVRSSAANACKGQSQPAVPCHATLWLHFTMPQLEAVSIKTASWQDAPELKCLQGRARSIREHVLKTRRPTNGRWSHGWGIFRSCEHRWLNRTTQMKDGTPADRTPAASRAETARRPPAPGRWRRPGQPRTAPARRSRQLGNVGRLYLAEVPHGLQWARTLLPPVRTLATKPTIKSCLSTRVSAPGLAHGTSATHRWV